MRTVRWLYLLPLVPLLLTSTVVFTPFAEAQTIRALLVGNDNNVPRYAKNMNMIVGLLRETNKVGTVKDSRVDYTTADVTPASERATKWLEDLRPGGNDVVFVYYSRAEEETSMPEEGAENDEQPDGPDPLDIVEFAKKLHKKPGRLKILITDADLHNVANANGSDEMEIPAVPESVLRNLFIEQKGFLHITNKSESEFAFGDAKGGWFTQTLVGAINVSSDVNNDGFVSWEEVMVKAQEGTKKLYEKNSSYFSDELKGAMNEHRIKESQTPMSLIDEFPTLNPTVHALLVIEDTPDAGNKPVADLNRVRIHGLFSGAQAFGLCNLNLTTLLTSQNSVTSDKIKAWAAALLPRDNDTAFIYYSSNDGNDVENQGEILNILKAAITGDNAKKSRLQMLIVDTHRVGPGKVVPRFSLPYPQTTFHNLLLEHTGFLHLVSRSEGELSFGDGYDGGWFTRDLIQAIYEIRNREDFPVQVPDNSEDRRPFLEWKELVEVTSKRTMKWFADSYPDRFEDAENYPADFSEEDRKKVLEALDAEGVKKSQTPTAYALPEKM